MIRIKYICRRRGYIGFRVLPDHFANNPLFLAPFRGVYKTVEIIEGVYACEYETLKPQLIYQSPEKPQGFSQFDYIGSKQVWVEDREEEKRQALQFVKVKSLQGDFCSSGC